MKLDSDGLKREPINLTEDTWLYEEKPGLALYHRGDRICIIPASTMSSYLRRLEARSNKRVQPTSTASKTKKVKRG